MRLRELADDPRDGSRFPAHPRNESASSRWSDQASWRTLREGPRGSSSPVGGGLAEGPPLRHVSTSNASGATSRTAAIAARIACTASPRSDVTP